MFFAFISWKQPATLFNSILSLNCMSGKWFKVTKRFLD